MDLLTDPANVALMLAAPAIQCQRNNFTQTTRFGKVTQCQLAYTPIPGPAVASAHPRPAPRAPVAPAPLPAAGRGRPSPERRQLVDEYNAALIEYAAAFRAYAALLQAHTDALAKFNNFWFLYEDQPAAGPLLIPDPKLIFTHGAGGNDGLNHPAVAAFTAGFARSQAVLCFEDYGDLTERVTVFRYLMNEYPTITAIGGRSRGTRASCRAAMYTPIKKLIFLSYPLHRGLSERYEELLRLDADTDVLFIGGTLDPMCSELLFKPVRDRMLARNWYIRVADGNHALWHAIPEVVTGICDVAGQIAAAWNNDDRDPAKTELKLWYDSTAQIVKWTGWMTDAEMQAL